MRALPIKWHCENNEIVAVATIRDELCKNQTCNRAHRAGYCPCHKLCGRTTEQRGGECRSYK